MVRAHNAEELWEMILNEWEELEDNYDMRQLVNSMPRRLESVKQSTAQQLNTDCHLSIFWRTSGPRTLFYVYTFTEKRSLVFVEMV